MDILIVENLINCRTPVLCFFVFFIIFITKGNCRYGDADEEKCARAMVAAYLKIAKASSE